jgi:2-C-methyl-D-erythritol 4-phosphate cytidylyltransferase
MAFHVLIPAAGNGSRMATTVPKQYLTIRHQPLIAHALRLFSESTLIDTVYVVLAEQDAHWRHYMQAYPLHQKVKLLNCGGETRAQTVLNGLHAMASKTKAEDWVLVHDAARPGLSHALLNDLISTLKDDAVGGLLALPLADTLKRADADHRVADTIPRNELWQAQTPQMFRYAMLKEALSQITESPTDEAQAIESLGFSPKLVTGSLINMKVTYPQDLAIISALMQLTE